MMTIGLLVWGMQATISYGGYLREVMFHVSKNDTSSFESHGKIERDNKVMYSFQSWLLTNAIK